MNNFLHNFFLGKTKESFCYFTFSLLGIEFLLHIVVVYFIPDRFLICNFTTVYSYFEGKDCANNTIAFLLLVIHPIVLLSIVWRYIVFNGAKVKTFEYQDEKHRYKQQDTFRFAIGQFMVFALFYSSLFIGEPYDYVSGRSNILNFGIPSCYFCEFMYILTILSTSTFFFVGFAATAYSAFYHAQYKRGNL